MRGLRALLALALAGAGCSSEAETFRLHLTWQQDGAYACPTGGLDVASCKTIPITCHARMLVRIAPREEGSVPYYTQCAELDEVPTDACALAGLDVATGPIPNEMVRLQVAVWTAAQLEGKPLAENGCPADVQFDAFGQPSTRIADPSLVPALGGEVYFPVGDRREAVVPLACPRYDLLAACQPPPQVRATVLEPSTRLVAVASDVADVMGSVRFAQPIPDETGGWTLPSDLLELGRMSGTESVWRGDLTTTLTEDPACVEVSSPGPVRVSAATCQAAAIDGAGHIDVNGIVVRASLLAQIERALEIGTVPDDGLVLGIVVDDAGRAVAGAKVSVRPPAAIKYPTDDFQHVGLDSTSARGFFLSTEAAFGSAWSAVGPSGIGDDGSARGGLLRGEVSVVIIRLNRPIGGGSAR